MIGGAPPCSALIGPLVGADDALPAAAEESGPRAAPPAQDSAGEVPAGAAGDAALRRRQRQLHRHPDEDSGAGGGGGGEDVGG